MEHVHFEGPRFVPIRQRVSVDTHCPACIRRLRKEMGKTEMNRMFPHSYDAAAHAKTKDNA
jgi:hypothetical protein